MTVTTNITRNQTKGKQIEQTLLQLKQIFPPGQAIETSRHAHVRLVADRKKLSRNEIKQTLRARLVVAGIKRNVDLLSEEQQADFSKDKTDLVMKVFVANSAVSEAFRRKIWEHGETEKKVFLDSVKGLETNALELFLELELYMEKNDIQSTLRGADPKKAPNENNEPQPKLPPRKPEKKNKSLTA